jgi:hypothetical protein
MRIFEALFKGVSTQFGPRAIEMSIENPHLIFCSAFQNLRLGGVILEDRTNISEHVSRGSTFQRFVAKIESPRP